MRRKTTNYYRRKYRRRRTTLKRRKYSKKATSIVVRSPTAFPDRTFVKLKYNLSRTVDPLVAAPTTYWTYRGNGAYDPEETTGGGQPLAWDQYSALYARYRCHASYIRINFMGTANDAGTFIRVVLYPSLSNVPVSSISNSATQPYARHLYIASNTGSNKGRLYSKMKTKKMLGLKSIAYSDEYVGLTASSNPAAEWYWLIHAATVNGTSNITGVYMDVQLVYYLEFFDRFSLTSS